MSRKPNVLLFTGHLLDSADRQTDRFPYRLLKEVKAHLKSEIDEITSVHKPQVAISSLAAGGDMIFAAEILDKKIPLTVFLPFEIEKFLDFSVTYMKGIPQEDPEQWAQRFRTIIQQAHEIIITGKTNDPPEDAFALCNEKMLSHALTLAGDNPRKVLALALIKSDEEPKRGGTAEFITLIQKQNVSIKRLWLNDGRPYE